MISYYNLMKDAAADNSKVESFYLELLAGSFIVPVWYFPDDRERWRDDLSKEDKETVIIFNNPAEESDWYDLMQMYSPLIDGLRGDSLILFEMSAVLKRLFPMEDVHPYIKVSMYGLVEAYLGQDCNLAVFFDPRNVKTFFPAQLDYLHDLFEANRDKVLARNRELRKEIL